MSNAIDTWEGTRTVVDSKGNAYAGTWEEDQSSTQGDWFLHLIDESGQKATGFGGLTPAEATEYGLQQLNFLSAW